MQTKYLCVLIHIWIKGEVGAPLNRFKPSSKIFYWPFQGGTSFLDLLCFCSVLCLLSLCARLFICALWSPAGKGLTSWLSFVVSNCEFVTFPLVSWVRCGTWLYQLLIFAPLLTLVIKELALQLNISYTQLWVLPSRWIKVLGIDLSVKSKGPQRLWQGSGLLVVESLLLCCSLCFMFVFGACW